MTWWEALLLGLLQGVTEFVPVSSSGHLVLGQYWLGLEMEGDLTFEVMVHFGTVLSILTVYWHRVRLIMTESFDALLHPTTLAESYRSSDGFRAAILVLITMVPTGLLYAVFRDVIGDAFTNPRFVSWMLFITGTFLILTMLRKQTTGDVGPLRAFILGIAQSFAMLPGISRSGTTISSAIYLNVKREKAADFSFLMLLPVVLGATLIEALDFLQGIESSVSAVALMIGTLAAYVSGIFAIKWVVIFTKREKLQYFAFYCFLVAALNLMLLS